MTEATEMAEEVSSTRSSVLVVHHLNSSRSQRILWLLEELQVPYEIKFYQRTPDRAAPEELFDAHPLGKSPVITDGDITLAESGAIVEYIIQKYGNGKAKPPAAGELDNLYYTHYAEGSLMPLGVLQYIFNFFPDRLPFFMRPLIRPIFSAISSRLVDSQLRIHMKLIEDHLTKTQGDFWVGGSEPTSADYMMLLAVEVFSLQSPEFVGPKAKAYMERMHARDAFKKALEKGGPCEFVR